MDLEERFRINFRKFYKGSIKAALDEIREIDYPIRDALHAYISYCWYGGNMTPAAEVGENLWCIVDELVAEVEHAATVAEAA